MSAQDEDLAFRHAIPLVTRQLLGRTSLFNRLPESGAVPRAPGDATGPGPEDVAHWLASWTGGYGPLGQRLGCHPRVAMSACRAAKAYLAGMRPIPSAEAPAPDASRLEEPPASQGTQEAMCQDSPSPPRPGSLAGGVRLSDLLSRSISQPRISLLCRALNQNLSCSIADLSALEYLASGRDTGAALASGRAAATHLSALFAGGLDLGRVVELAGAPGLGKTQIAIQACTMCTLPADAGGVGRPALYIDTEGSFLPSRVREIATGVLADLAVIRPAAARDLSVDAILDSIFHVRVHDVTELMAVCTILPDLVAEKSIGLVVIDSLAFPLRHGEGARVRSLALSSIAGSCSDAALRGNCAVLLLNQMTTRFEGRSAGTGSLANLPSTTTDSGVTLVPALGESWGHVCTSRTVLTWDRFSNQRIAYQFKCPVRGPSRVPYSVEQGGVRDPGFRMLLARTFPSPSPTVGDELSRSPPAPEQQPPLKRPKLQ
ncbi:hypothetical protein H696_06212 [Fonticula alba]|uniref:DNA repair protein RAD51 homolog 3 n=1 Tax=Fonticula alba TaxID=691883 RepID=A0A058YZE1_FONAL|nr:hypothetical protein H696_06212 [Fonticula alba]KCV67360.1 hypothetical protein H696_06212 [Fonticula alba]|eukprot:XP_009498233.1 hypothetical protein H696_06212 [Fonticula alba]